MKKLKLSDTAMVKITNPVNTSIAKNKIVPVIYTKFGLMLFSNVVGIHIDPSECDYIDMPLQCVL